MSRRVWALCTTGLTGRPPLFYFRMCVPDLLRESIGGCCDRSAARSAEVRPGEWVGCPSVGGVVILFIYVVNS